MKEITVYAIGQQNPKSKHGTFYVSLQYNENKRYIKGVIPKSTASESVSRGVLTALEKLTEPCSVNVFVTENIRKNASGYMGQIATTAEEKGCEIKINVCKGKEGKTVKSSARKPTAQEEARSQIKGERSLFAMLRSN